MTKLHLKATSNVYIRKEANRNSDPKGMIYKDQEFDFDGEIVEGEEVQSGNKKWYHGINGDYFYSGAFEEHSIVIPAPPERETTLTGDEQAPENIITPGNPTPPNWQIEKFGIRKIWEKTKGADVKIAIIDSGMMIDHPEFDPEKIILTRNFLYKGKDDTLKKDVTDEYGHGTHCCGVIAAQGIKCFGVAPEAKLLIGKIYKDDKDPIDSSNFMDAIIWAFENDADIISISLTIKSLTQEDRKTISTLSEQKPKVIIVGSIENGKEKTWDNDDICPPNIDQCFSVGNIDFNNKIYDTQRTTLLDILAPGFNIYSTWNNKSYETLSGCSFATPFVVGVIALLLDLDRRKSIAFNRDEVLNLLKTRTTSFATYNSKKEPYPIIDPFTIFAAY